jgi:hypothetical protein
VSPFGGILESGIIRSVLCRSVWKESGFSRREDVFIFNLLYKENVWVVNISEVLVR